MTTPQKPTISEIEKILIKYLPIASIPTEDWNSVVKEITDQLLALFHSSTQSAVNKAEKRMIEEVKKLKDGDCYWVDLRDVIKLLNNSKQG